MAKKKRPTYDDIIRHIKSHRDPESVAGMARYGINPEKNYGVCMPEIMELAKRVGTDHALAERLWSSGIRDAMILACMIDDPRLVTEVQMDRWVRDFRSWDICDGCCLHLFADAAPAAKKAVEWAESEGEYTRRAGYVMIAVLAVHDKKSGDEVFRRFLPLIVKGSTDERNYVKKAVNWALRQIGKRSLNLNKEAVAVAKQIERMESKAARWIAKDALRELRSERTLERLRKKADRR